MVKTALSGITVESNRKTGDFETRLSSVSVEFDPLFLEINSNYNCNSFFQKKELELDTYAAQTCLKSSVFRVELDSCA